jgi:hypothetical protein
MIFGPLGAILLSYLCTNDFFDAVTRTVILYYGLSLPFWQNIVGLGIMSLIFFYFLYMIRYMRLKLVDAKNKLISLLPKGEDTYDEIFGLVSKSKVPIFFGLLFMAFYAFQAAPDLPYNFKVFCIHPANTVFLFVAYPFWFIIFTTFVWMYLGSIRGLFTLGKRPLSLKPFHQDKMLGVRPVGSLSLSLAFAYFGGLSILALLPSVLSPDTPTISYVLTLSFFMLLGVIFFFLPLYTIHRKMHEVKLKEQEKLHNELFKVVQKTDNSKIKSESISDIKDSLNRLTSVLTVEVTKDEVENIPTWPIDFAILRRLLTMTISIIGIIIANFIMKTWLRF